MKVGEKALEFSTEVYAVTRTFPRHELFGLAGATLAVGGVDRL
jgi:hypothetical protein